MAALTASEQDRLEHCVAIVRAGQQTFLEVASALAEIREGKLYRATHASFGEFARETFGFERAHANRLAAAGEIAAAHPGIQNERQAREVARVPVERRAEVVERSTGEDGTVDSARLRENVRAVAEVSPVGDTHEAPEPAGPDTGEFDRLLGALRSAIRDVKALGSTSAGAFLPVQRVVSALQNAGTALKHSIPTCPCYACRDGVGCKVCRGTGWITEELEKARPEVVE